MAGNAFVAARLAAIEKEVAELRKQIVRKPRRARKSTYDFIDRAVGKNTKKLHAAFRRLVIPPCIECLPEVCHKLIVPRPCRKKKTASGVNAVHIISIDAKVPSYRLEKKQIFRGGIRNFFIGRFSP